MPNTWKVNQFVRWSTNKLILLFVYLQGRTLSVNDGESTLFWQDVWLHDKSLELSLLMGLNPPQTRPNPQLINQYLQPDPAQNIISPTRPNPPQMPLHPDTTRREGQNPWHACLHNGQSPHMLLHSDGINQSYLPWFSSVLEKGKQMAHSLIFD